MCSRHKQLPHVIGIGPQWATTNVRHKATVVLCRVLSIDELVWHCCLDVSKRCLSLWNTVSYLLSPCGRNQWLWQSCEDWQFAVTCIAGIVDAVLHDCCNMFLFCVMLTTWILLILTVKRLHLLTAKLFALCTLLHDAMALQFLVLLVMTKPVDTSSRVVSVMRRRAAQRQYCSVVFSTPPGGAPSRASFFVLTTDQFSRVCTVHSSARHSIFCCSCWICNCERSDVVNNCTYFYLEIYSWCQKHA